MSPLLASIDSLGSTAVVLCSVILPARRFFALLRSPEISHDIGYHANENIIYKMVRLAKPIDLLICESKPSHATQFLH